MAIDKRGNNGIMTSNKEGDHYDDRTYYPSISRQAGELHDTPTGTESDPVSKSESPSRTPQDGESRTGSVGNGTGGSGSALREEPEGERRAGHNGVEQGDSSGNIAVAERLKPRDLVLNDKTDIGFNAGAATKFEANLQAIKTLKNIEDRNGQATPEEQKIISRFSGWGDSGFSEAFPAYEHGGFSNTPWGRRRAELKALTTESEFDSIEKSRLNAFFTTPEVISHIWQALDKMGVGKLDNPRILEPSAGSGRFLGLEPENITNKSRRVAVELDDLTGRMLKQMYPQADTYIMGYERAPIPKESIDVAISNVPFGNYPVFDSTFKKERKKFTGSIHNYFFGKTIERLRPGGVLAFVTSHFTLDAANAKPVRQMLAKDADLIGAIRLPKNAFPDTQVITDIVIMRKRMPGEKPLDTSWVDTETVKLPMESDYDDKAEAEMEVNKYFVKHPEMVLGKQTANGSMNPHRYNEGEYTVEPSGKSLSTLLTEAIKTVPRDIITEAPRREMTRIINKDAMFSSTLREGSRAVGENGNVFVMRGDSLVSADLTEAEETKVKALLDVRDKARAVVDAQVANKKDAELGPLQRALRESYKKFVLENGALNNPQNAELLSGDPDMPFLKALENTEVFKKQKKELTEEDNRVIKIFNGKLPYKERDIDYFQMPIFTARVIHGLGEIPVATEEDAIAVVKNEVGRLDFNIMAQKLGKTPEQVIQTLKTKHIIYRNPMTGEYEPAEQYLTGDVRDKLTHAIDAASAKPGEYKANVEALKTVQPADIPAGQISARMGAPWIPEEDINDFVKDLLKARERWRSRDEGRNQYFKYNETTGDWAMVNKPDASTFTMTEEFGTSRMSAPVIINRILNGKLIEVNDQIVDADGKKHSVRNPQETIAAQEKAKLIQDAFQKWIWNDIDRANRLAKDYNLKFNSYRPRFFDGSYLELPGISEKWNRLMHAHQRDAIARVIMDRTALLAHEVGFGKTAEMVVSGKELRRLGLAKKVMYVTPKATHDQFKNQYLDLYPFAKILYPTEEDFTPEKRAEFMSRAVTGDWDAIIVADSQFKKIPVRPETEARFLSEEMNTIEEALAEAKAEGKDKKTQKQLAAALEKAKVRMEYIQARLNQANDKTVYFEDIGVDQLFVDEADTFKNLRFTTKMGRIKGLPNSESDRAWDMYQKTRTLLEQPHTGVVFATGTPIANTIAEMYTMMRYLQEPMLEEKGLKHFDAWAKTFGETVESLEQTAAGTYRMTQRFAKFSNAPELSNLWQQTADIRVADEVPEMVKQRPRIVDEAGKNRRTVISAAADKALSAYMDTIVKRADELKNKKPWEDNMLKIASDARKASLDMRMVDASAPFNPNGKISLMCKKINEIYKQEKADKGTQLVFLDLATPKAKDKKADEPTETNDENVVDEESDEEQKLLRDVYNNIKSQLIADGVKESEIAFIHEAKNDKQRNNLQDRVNRGDIRVLIGSTGKMGAGINVQERAAALHHLDAPWRPRDIEQREGRIVRQGNIVYGPKRDENGKVIDPGKGVKIFTYVTERSFDGFMWQSQESKSKAIKSIMRRSVPPRVVEDIDSFTMSASEAKAIASGNPDVFKTVALKNQANRLQMIRASHVDSVIRAKSQLQMLPLVIKSLKEDVVNIEKDVKLATKDSKFAIKINGDSYSERPEAGEALFNAVRQAKTESPIAQYNGFNVVVHDYGPQTGYGITLKNPDSEYKHVLNNIPYNELTAAGIITRLDNKIKAMPGTLESISRQLKDNENNFKTYEVQATAPFEHEDRLAKMELEIARLEKRLQAEKVEGEVSENYVPDPELEEVEVNVDDDEIGYHFSERTDEPKPNMTINPVAEIKAVAQEVEPVEKATEVKLPPASAEKVIDSIAIPVKKLKIGDAITIMDIDAILADSHDIGGVRYELFNAAKGKDKRGIVRITDIETGNVVTLKSYEEYDKAEKELKDAVWKSEHETPENKPKETRYKAMVTDKETGKAFAIAREYPTKEAFIFDLRRNGYAVDSAKVKTEAEFDRIINTTNGEKWDWQPKKYDLTTPSSKSSAKDIDQETEEIMAIERELGHEPPKNEKEKPDRRTAPPPNYDYVAGNSKPLFVNFETPTGKKFIKVEEAKRIKVRGEYGDFDFYVHPRLDDRGMPDDKSWDVTEGRSGGRIGSGDTPEKAMDSALSRLFTTSKEKFSELVNNAVERFGESPAYAKPKTAEEMFISSPPESVTFNNPDSLGGKATARFDKFTGRYSWTTADKRVHMELPGEVFAKMHPAENANANKIEPWQMTPKEFNKAYYQHMDIRAKDKEEAERHLEAIKKEGFQSNNLNTFSPTTDYREVGWAKTYQTKKGVKTYAVPVSSVNKHGAILQGWKPSDSEVVDITEDGESLHKAIVVKAVREGKPVPPEVLVSYPGIEQVGTKKRQIIRQENLGIGSGKMAYLVKDGSSFKAVTEVNGVEDATLTKSLGDITEERAGMEFSEYIMPPKWKREPDKPNNESGEKPTVIEMAKKESYIPEGLEIQPLFKAAEKPRAKVNTKPTLPPKPEKQPWELTKEEFEKQYPKLRELDEDAQRLFMTRLHKKEKREWGIEDDPEDPWSVENARKGTAAENRFNYHTGEMFQDAHSVALVSAMERGEKIPQDILALYPVADIKAGMDKEKESIIKALEESRKTELPWKDRKAALKKEKAESERLEAQDKMLADIHQRAQEAEIETITLLKAKIKPFIEKQKTKGGLTDVEASEYRDLASQIASIKYDQLKNKPLEIAKIPAPDARKSVIPVEVVKIAHDNLMKNKKVYEAIADASFGVFHNADTAVDLVMDGKNPNITASEFYKTFDDTREALKNKFGDYITLYRSVGSQKDKSTSNWASTREIAEQYGDNVVARSIPIADIVAFNPGPNGKYEEFIVSKPLPSDYVSPKSYDGSQAKIQLGKLKNKFPDMDFEFKETGTPMQQTYLIVGNTNEAKKEFLENPAPITTFADPNDPSKILHAHLRPITGNYEWELPDKHWKFATPAEMFDIMKYNPLPSTSPEKPVETIVVEGGEVVSEPAKKEPWKMTKQEFINSTPVGFSSERETYADAIKMHRNKAAETGNKFSEVRAEKLEKLANQDHKILVESALKKGMPVPSEVLKDYPELAVSHKAETSTKLTAAQHETLDREMKKHHAERGDIGESGYIRTRGYGANMRIVAVPKEEVDRVRDRIINGVAVEVKPVKIKNITLAKLEKIHDSRSARAQAADEAKRNQRTFQPNDPRAISWTHDPGSSDVSGIDTKNKVVYKSDKIVIRKVESKPEASKPEKKSGGVKEFKGDKAPRKIKLGAGVVREGKRQHIELG
jgi:N12 class adenine-specific DNA methylase